MTYSEKLKDPRWQKRRLKVMEYAKFRCQICGDGKKTLHCHHSYYTKGKQPWQYPEGSIICICEHCHEKLHGKEKKKESEEIIPQIAFPLEVKRTTFGALRKLLEDELAKSGN